MISDLALPLAYTEDASAAANHSSSSAVFLSGARMHKNTNLLGVTVDQMAARHIGQDSLMPSLELGIEDSSNSCGEGWSCAYRDTISWLDERTPLPVERNPQVLFERLFGTGATKEARASNRVESRSILDAVSEQTARLNRDLPASDRQPPGSIPHRCARDRAADADRKPRFGRRAAARQAFRNSRTISRITSRRCSTCRCSPGRPGMTRVSTLMLAKEASNAAYPKSGVRDAFHPLSHHSNIQANKDKLAQINRYHIGLFGYLLEKMRQTPDGEATLLDNSILMWGSGMGDSNVHNHDPLPILLAGGGAGRLKGGRHINAGQGGKKVPLSNLHLALLHKAGIEAKTFGDSTGTVDI